MAEEWTKKNKSGNDKLNDSWKPENEGDEIVGVYIDRRDNVGKDAKTIYTIKKADDVEMSVWGNKIINDAMSDVEIGYMVKIVFLGKKPTKTPGQRYNDFDVFAKAVDGDVNPDDIPF